MRAQGVVERLEHRGGEPLVSDVEHGVEVVGFGAQGGALLSGHGHGNRSIEVGAPLNTALCFTYERDRS
ncbi:hypothetical protein rosag_32540 [Roseisolibacter agri]|uniref:Uncharacterized protein n=1 Tax=Roseisolibacter agri TaxID=2014610 RepID=A0AA37V7K2_9BACT|nr:hypothetical protein rosag_32540 [Roseisolibacter agri]